MGTDNLHFKKKEIDREIKKRKPRMTVLIVCEGSKTEPNYLRDLCAELRLSSINIKPCSSGTNSMKIVNEAINDVENKEYDIAYCVFDKDDHKDYQKAVEKIESKAHQGVSVHAITSVPCFEYWLLLHFHETTKPYQRKGKKSAAGQLLSELKIHFKGYDKACNNVFGQTKHRLNDAMTRAKRIDKSQQEMNTDNPSTKVYQLVEKLQSLHRTKK